MQAGKPWLLDAGHMEMRRAGVREFIQGEEYLGLGDAVFPEVVRTLETIFTGGYDEAALCWGIGSGKSFLSGLALTYMAHSVLCLRDPQRSLGMAPGSAISLMVVAPTERQARDVVYAEVVRRVMQAPWFCGLDPAPQALAGELRLPRGLRVVAGNSSETFALGYNVLGAVVDEAAWFPWGGPERRETVEDIYHALKRRVTSRFMDRDLVLMISSPRAAGDFMERRLAATEEDPRAYGSRKPVWQVRPAHYYSGECFLHDGISIPVEYRRDFDVNPQRALRDLAAVPTRGADVFFADAQVLEAAVDDTLCHPLDDSGRLHGWFRPPDGGPRYLHVDLGLTRDACALAMARCEAPDHDDAEPGVVVELVHRITAPEGGEVDLSRPREIILALRKRGFNVAQVSYDGWQSVDSRQILRRAGIRTKLVSVDRTMTAYETLKGMLLDGRVRMCRHDWFLREAAALEVAGGMKVDHPPGGSKDVADAVAGAVSEAVGNWGAESPRAAVL